MSEQTTVLQEPLINRTELIKRLKFGVVEVEFIKKDGSPRVMQATLAPELLPPIAEGEESEESTNRLKKNDGGNLDLINCFDIEAQGWRCFKISSLTKKPERIRIGVGASECGDGMCSACSCSE
ncbi:MAG: DUF2693 domain-containing protein [Desulfobulbaceae bacterium]|nr:DUF2693 domain-containing protein [Desulfobulbaceae bacterium]